MATIGVNTALWTLEWRDERKTEQLLRKIRGMGFDAIQIPLLKLDTIKPESLLPVVTAAGLRCYISAGLSADTDVTSGSDATRRAGVDYLKRCLQVARVAGCTFMSGSFHSVFGMKACGPVEAIRWRRSADCLKEVAREARRLDMEIALEPINRYESFLVNSAEQAVRLIGMIGEDNVKVQLDTFHMNMEEESIGDAIRKAGSSLIHFHVAENHRGRFGHGSMPWDEVFSALRDIDYQGAIVIESFVPSVQPVATSACIWRSMAASADALAAEGVPFLRGLAERYGIGVPQADRES